MHWSLDCSVILQNGICNPWRKKHGCKKVRGSQKEENNAHMLLWIPADNSRQELWSSAFRSSALTCFISSLPVLEQSSPICCPFLFPSFPMQDGNRFASEKSAVPNSDCVCPGARSPLGPRTDSCCLLCCCFKLQTA